MQDHKMYEQLLNENIALRGQVADLQAKQTERVHTSEEFRREQQKAQQYLDVAGVMFVAINADQQVILINKKGCDILGYTEAEVLGKNWFETFLPISLREPVKKVFNKLMADEIAPVEYFENPVLTKDGTERLIAWHNALLRDNDGHIIGTLSSGEDITERKQAEDALRTSEASYRLLAEHATDMISKHAPDGTYVYASPACRSLLGYEPEELVGRNAYDFFHPDDIAAIRHSHATVLEKPVTTTISWRVRRKNGQYRWVETTNRAIRNPDAQEVLEIIAMTRDISERKQAEAKIRTLNAELEQRVHQRTAELEAVNKELQHFAYVVSHDLKAPLRGISHLAYWLMEDYATLFDDVGKQQVQLLLSRVQRLDDLIEGILQYSRIGRLEKESQQVDTRALLTEVIDNLAPPSSLQMTIDQNLPSLLINKTRITQVFQNLIGNALKFMDKPDGKIRIGCQDAGRYWQFSVVDNGPGIDPKYHKKIFQIFQVLQPRDELESTGIGLSLVKKIIDLYGGSIWVESAVGKGSTFFFTLPK